MSDTNGKTRKKSVNLSAEVLEIVSSLATKRDLTLSAAAEHLIRVGGSRVKALKAYAKAQAALKKEATA